MMMMCGGVCYIGGDKIFSRFTDFWSEIDGEREKGSSIINLSVYHFFSIRVKPSFNIFPFEGHLYLR